MSNKEPFKPGQICPTSGQYEVIGPRGGSKDREITISEGETFPPGQFPGERFVITDATKHKSR